tara:strand:+ start:490 stop:753 length:264 start_codon:yes stop_codon:yes gene_type:complete
MDKKIRGISKVRSIINEIAYDLGIDKKLVRQVLLLTFKEIAVTLILRGRPIMIRRFVKFVVAATAVKKMANENKKERMKEKTKEEVK